MKIERKCHRILQPFHYVVGKLADLPRHIQDESPRWVGVFAGNDDDGAVSAASPRSASQISPGGGSSSSARARNIEDIVVGELYYLGDSLSGLCRRFRLPLAQSSV